MKIKMTGQAFSPYGGFEKGQELTERALPVAYMYHLVNDCHVAEIIESEKKIETRIIEPEIKPQPKKRGRKKKILSS